MKTVKQQYIENITDKLSHLKSYIEIHNSINLNDINFPDNLEMLYADCLINVGEFEKAQTLISSRMEDVEENLETFYNNIITFILFKVK